MTEQEVIIDSRSDEELVAAALADQSAYGILMRRYEPKLGRYVRHLAGLPGDDVQDVLQETFLKAYINLNSFDRSLKFSAWVYRIAHNETISFIRKRKSSAQPLPTVDEEEAAVIVERLSVEPDFVEAWDRHRRAECLRSAISRLDPKYRDVLVLRYFEERDYTEISDILMKPMGTVATLLNRAKQALRKELADSNHPAL